MSAPMSGMPVACPLASLQLMTSSKVVTNSDVVPTSAKSFSHAAINAFRVSLALSLES